MTNDEEYTQLKRSMIFSASSFRIYGRLKAGFMVAQKKKLFLNVL